MEVLMALAFAFLVMRVELVPHTDVQAPNEPVYHNYNGGFIKK